MDTKRFVLAVVVVFLLMSVMGYLIHGLWLGGEYNSMRDNGFSFRTMDALRHRIWIIWISDLIYSLLFVGVYVRGREDKPWAGQGFRFGILMTLFTVVPGALNDYAAYELPHTLVAKWIVSYGVIVVILGLIVAAICQKKPAAA